jgi:hypothetical protein
MLEIIKGAKLDINWPPKMSRKAKHVGSQSFNFSIFCKMGTL